MRTGIGWSKLAKTVQHLAFLLTLSILVPGVALAQDDNAEEVSTEQLERRGTVTLDGHEIFAIGPTDKYSAFERAERIRDRIVQAATQPGKAPTASVVKHDIGYAITAGGVQIILVTQDDIDDAGLDGDDLATYQQRQIQKALTRYRADRQLGALTLDAGRTLLWTLAYLAALYALHYGRLRFRLWASERVSLRLKIAEERTAQVIDAEAIYNLTRRLVVGVFWIIFGGLTYAYLVLVLSAFPYTRELANILTSYALAPIIDLVRAVVFNIPNFFALALIISVAVYLNRVMRVVFSNISKGIFKPGNFEKEWAIPTFRIARVVLIIVTVMICYPFIPGSSTDAFKGISIFVGVLVSIGGTSIFSNMLASLVVTYKRSIYVGDRIKVGDILGDVENFSLLETQVRTVKNELVGIPNTKLLSDNIINYSRMKGTTGVKIHSTVGIGYETPKEQVEALLISAAKKIEGVREKPGPFVLVTELTDFEVKYQINAHILRDADTVTVLSNLNKNILDAFRAAQVQIMTPNYRADPPEPKVPPPLEATKG